MDRASITDRNGLMSMSSYMMGFKARTISIIRPSGPLTGLRVQLGKMSLQKSPPKIPNFSKYL